MIENFIKDEKDLINSVVEFFSKPEYWKSTIGNAPKYFVHIKNGKSHTFGLSKFCAFKNITVENYISKYRYLTNGGETQKRIVTVTNQKWVKRSEVDNEIREHFDNWILNCHPNYNLENASFISLNQSTKIYSKKAKFVNPENLEKSLIHQKIIGEIGEEIAFHYEFERLKHNGVANILKVVEHISKTNSAAGFDIRTLAPNDNRYIEVKSSLKNNSEFFITENEFKTLKELGDEAFIYRVLIENFEKKIGYVYSEIQNPIEYLKSNGKMKPVVFKVKIK